MSTPARARSAVPARAVDPAARRITRVLAHLEPWARPVRWLLAAVAGFMAIELVPYALWWQGTAHLWAVAGLAAASGTWLAMPSAVRAAHRRAVVSPQDLGSRSDAAVLLAAACDARVRFEAAAAQLNDARRWVRDARRRLAQTTWSVAVRAREISRLEGAVRDLRAGADGPRHRAEKDRLTAALDAHRGVAEELAAELVHLADVAERTALAISGLGRRSAPLPELSDSERAAVDSLRWFRLRLEAVEDAWVELNEGPALPGGPRADPPEGTVTPPEGTVAPPEGIAAGRGRARQRSESRPNLGEPDQRT
jgi:hypothetical protein